MAGHTYAAIGDRLQIGPAAAFRHVQEALEATRETSAGIAKDLRELELQRLDAILSKLWDKRGDPRTADTLIRISKRRSNLQGLDAPLKIAETTPTGEPVARPAVLDLSRLTEVQLEQLEEILRAAARPDDEPS